MATPSDGGGQTFSNRNITSYFTLNSTSICPCYSPRPSSPCVLGGRPLFQPNSDGFLPAVQDQQQAPQYWKHPTADQVPPHGASSDKRLWSRSAGLGKTTPTSFSDQHQLPPGCCLCSNSSHSPSQQSTAQSCEMSTSNKMLLLIFMTL